MAVVWFMVSVVDEMSEDIAQVDAEESAPDAPASTVGDPTGSVPEATPANVHDSSAPVEAKPSKPPATRSPPAIQRANSDTPQPPADDITIDVLADTLLMFAQPRESDIESYEPGMDDEMPSFQPAPHVKTTIDKLKQNTRELLRYARSLNEAIERVEKQTAV